MKRHEQIPRYEGACNRVKLPSKRAAQGRARALGFAHVYRCKVCHNWHVQRLKPEEEQPQ